MASRARDTGPPVLGKRAKIIAWIRKRPTTAHHPNITQPSNKTAISLWERAYKELQNDSADLVKQYEDLEKLILKDAPVDSSSKNRLDSAIALGLKQLKEGKLHDAGHSVQEALAKAAKIVTWAKEWIDQAVEASPQASIAWSIISLGIPLLTYPTSADKDCKEGFTYTVSRMRYYARLEPGILELGSHMEPIIIDFYKAVLDYQIRSVLRFYRNSFMTFVRDVIQLEDWRDMLRILTAKEDQLYRDFLQSSSLIFHEELSTLATAAVEIDVKMKFMIKEAEQQSEMQVAIRDNTKEIVEQQKELLQYVITSKERECLQLFRLLDSTSDHDQSYEFYKKRNPCRVEGTCLWFLNHTNFLGWLAQDSGPLLVTADPGCGKSVLAAYLIDDVLPQPTCYFFFKDQVQDRVYQALCALLHQMLSKQPALIRLVKPYYDFNGRGLVENTTLLWELFCEVSNSFGSLTIVLDALDECNEKDRKGLLMDLRKYLGKTKAKFLLTSRPYEHVTGKLQGLIQDFPNIRIPGEDSSDKISPEIDLVITARVSQLAEEMRFKDDLKDYIIRRLTAIPQRTYLWVHLVLDYLETGFKKTPHGFLECVNQVPASINEAYERILLQSGLSDTSSTSRIVLNLLLGARRALGVDELQIAVELVQKPQTRSSSEFQLESPAEFKDTLRRECGLLLAFQDDKVYFLHQTVREFLLGSSNKMKQQGSFDLNAANNVCRVACVNHLLLYSFYPACHNGRLWEIPTTHRYPLPTMQGLESYATDYCIEHFQRYQEYGSGCGDLNEKAPESRNSMTDPYNIHISARDSKGRTIAHHVAAATDWSKNLVGERGFMKAILSVASEAGVDMSAQDDSGSTAVHSAVNATLGYRDLVIRELFISGANVNIPDHAGKTPLHHCVSMPCGGTLPRKIDTEPPKSRRCRQPQAVRNDGESGMIRQIARALLSCYADPNIHDHDGQTPLHSLILEHDKHSVRHLLALASMLIEAGSNLKIRDNAGKTALDYAMAIGERKIIKLLKNDEV